MTTAQKVIKTKMGLLELAKQLGNVADACRVVGYRRDSTYSKVAAAKLYTEKTPITAADLRNDRVLPLFEAHDTPLTRMLTDRGTEYWGAHDRHPSERSLAVNDIEHTRPRLKRPQTNELCERFQNTVLNECYRVGGAGPCSPASPNCSAISTNG